MKVKCEVDIKDFLIWAVSFLTQKKSLVFQIPGFFCPNFGNFPNFGVLLLMSKWHTPGYYDQKPYWTSNLVTVKSDCVLKDKLVTSVRREVLGTY